MDTGLKDKTVVITGANSGIGLACATAFAAEGARVVAGDLETSQLSGVEGVLPVKLDLLASAGPQTLVDRAVNEFGTVDVLVNNLGGAKHRETFLDVDDAAWQATFALNFTCGVRSCRAALPVMVKQGKGAIISVASDAGRQPDPFYVDYCVAKAAVISMVKSVSIEFGPKGIRANAVAPGPTLTPGLIEFFEKSAAPKWGMTTEAAIDHFAKNIRKLPLGKLGQPEDVAAIVVFLGSDLAKQITGSIFGVDGGVMHVM
jgi:NAD(P)-dependent dehydrogenase (short-subunit alcohol dehydrogenase family)